MKIDASKTGFWTPIEIQQLVDDTRAHLPKDEKYKFWADRRLAEMCLVLEALMPYGAIQIERPQPAVMWALVYKENGKRKVAFSFDGPPSAAYMKLTRIVTDDNL